MTQATGSIWNTNNWHWESKNYTPLAKKIIQEKIMSIELRIDDDELHIDKIDLTGEVILQMQAQVNVRKGKQILCYDFEATCDFTCGDVDGKFKIREINAQEMDFEIYDLRVEKSDQKVQKIKEYFKIFMHKKIEEKLKTVNEEIMKIESDPEKIKQDQIKRQENADQTKIVRELTGEQKEKMLQEQKEKDRLFREQEFLRSQQQKIQ